MKKGVTLIELLSVLIILSIILTIAIPQILLIIEKSKDEIILKNNEILVKAAKSYLIQEKHLFPTQIGGTQEVTIEKLQEGKYLKELKNPNNKSEDCNGYVLITKTEDNNFDYTPHINCENDIANSEEDKLLFHYKFDDFQEPTVNLFPQDGSFDSSSGVHIGDIGLSNGTGTILGGGWRCATHYNDGECKIEQGGVVSNNKLVWYHNNVFGWKGATATSSVPVEANKTYTISIWTKTNETSLGTYSAYALYGPEGYRNHFTWNESPWLNPGKWIRGTRTISPDIAFSGGVYLYGATNGLPGLKIEYDGYQIEEKPYATEYTNNTRTGIVKDYSINSNHANLNISTTPRWMENDRTKKGMYLFNGDNSYILSDYYPNFNANDDFTFSIWVKFKEPITFQSRLFSIDRSYAQSYGFYTETNGNVAFAVRTDTNSISKRFSPELEKWYHLVGVYNGTNKSMDLYINGKKEGNTEYFSPTGVELANNRIVFNRTGAWVGGEAQGTTVSYMDNARIYKRSLNENEVNTLYKLEIK